MVSNPLHPIYLWARVRSGKKPVGDGVANDLVCTDDPRWGHNQEHVSRSFFGRIAYHMFFAMAGGKRHLSTDDILSGPYLISHMY